MIGPVRRMFRDDRREFLEDAVMDALDPTEPETCAHIEYAGGMALQFVDDDHDAHQLINVTGFRDFLSPAELIREVDRPVVDTDENMYVVFEIEADSITPAVEEIDRIAIILGFRRRASTKIRCFRTANAEEIKDMSNTEMIRTLITG